MTAAVTRINQISTGVQSPPVQVSHVFSYQSFFSDTAAGQAILTQNLNDQIVEAQDPLQVHGYAVALRADSETPVAIRFDGNGSGGGSSTYVLKPGELICPRRDMPFSGLRWGLPFGWLGGGLATLVIFQEQGGYDSTTLASGREVIFHRIRLETKAAPAGPSTLRDLVQPWPTRFPHLGTERLSGADVVRQGGNPLIRVQPSKTLLRLRTSPLVADLNVRAFFFFSDALDPGTATASPDLVPFVDFTFPAFAALGGATATDHEIILAPALFNMLGCERIEPSDSGIVLVAGTTGLKVDVVRYGLL